MRDREHSTPQDSVERRIAKDLLDLQARVERLLDEYEALSSGWAQSGPDDPNHTVRALTYDKEEAIEYALHALAERLLMYTEVLALPRTRTRVADWYSRFGKALSKISHWSTSDGDGFESPAFTELRHILGGVLAVCGDPQPPSDSHRSAERRDLQRLEHALRSLAKYCREHNIVPCKENEVQEAMHTLLDNVFDDYTKTPVIAKPLVSFKPDGGVISLQAAIECKFVDSVDEAKTALHGLTEDVAGYAGSKDWTRFYSLIYMTGPFAAEGQFHRAFELSSKAAEWTHICVTGAGGRRRAPRSRSRTPAAEAAGPEDLHAASAEQPPQATTPKPSTPEPSEAP